MAFETLKPPYTKEALLNNFCCFCSQLYAKPAKLANFPEDARKHKEGVYDRLYEAAKKPRQYIQEQASPYPFSPIIFPGTEKFFAGKRHLYRNTNKRVSESKVVDSRGAKKGQGVGDLNADTFTFKPCLNDQTARILQTSRKQETKDFGQRLLTSVLKYYERISGNGNLKPQHYTLGSFHKSQTDHDGTMHGDNLSWHHLTY